MMFLCSIKEDNLEKMCANWYNASLFVPRVKFKTTRADANIRHRCLNNNSMMS